MQVIPDRMPDCSYFSQGVLVCSPVCLFNIPNSKNSNKFAVGLCTNKNCPYRHVHVNPNASTCEGFLKGYCADGNEVIYSYKLPIVRFHLNISILFNYMVPCAFDLVPVICLVLF